MELAILHTLSTEANYWKYAQFVPKQLVSRETFTIMSAMKDWYKSSAPTIDWPSFASWFKIVLHAGMKVEQLELYSSIFDRMDGFIPTGTDLEIVNALISRDFASRISEASGDVADGVSTDLTVVDDLMNDWHVETGHTSKSESKIVTCDIDEIMETVLPSGGLKWRLPELNLSLGPVRKGDFIIMAARPGAGKTTMLASESTYLAEQMIEDDKYVLWFCNEEIGKRVKYKVIQSSLALTDKEMVADRHKAKADYITKLHGDRVVVQYDSTWSQAMIEQELRPYEGHIGLIIFDQLSNFQTSGSNTNEVSQQGKLFAWARGMSRHAPVITAHQLKGTAQGVIHPDMDQLYGSTTLVQGACDAIVMIGQPTPEHHPSARGLSVPRNKLIGDLKSEGKFRNAKFEVTLKHEIVRYKGAF